MSLVNTLKKPGISKPPWFTSSSAKHEQSQQQTSARSSTNYSKHSPIGSKNHGNTCFLNATLQAIASCEILTPAMLKEHMMLKSPDFNKTLTSSMAASSQLNQELLDALIKSIYYLRHHDVLEDDCLLTNGRKTVDTYITKLINRFPQFPNPTLKIGTQEDAHEFYINILLILQNTRSYYQSMIDASIHNNDFSVARKKQESEKFINFPYVASLFEGKRVSTVYCLECGQISQRPELFLDIPLQIQSSNSLQESFNQHFEMEKLANDNAYECEHCGKKTEAWKYNHISHTPAILTIQLKRFSYEGKYFQKLTDFLPFPQYLSINSYPSLPEDVFKLDNESRNELMLPPISEFYSTDSSSHERAKSILSTNTLCPVTTDLYELKSMVIHVGDRIENGHYISYVERDREWYCVDDLKVRKSAISDVLKQPAYLLFYEKLSSTADTPSLSSTDNVSTVLLTNVNKETIPLALPDHSERIPVVRDPNRHYLGPPLPSVVTINVKSTLTDESAQKTTEKVYPTPAPAITTAPAGTTSRPHHLRTMHEEEFSQVPRKSRRTNDAISASNDDIPYYYNEMGKWDDEFSNQNPTIPMQTTTPTTTAEVKQSVVSRKRSIGEDDNNQDSSGQQQPSKKQKRQVSMFKKPWKWMVSFGKFLSTPMISEDNTAPQQPSSNVHDDISHTTITKRSTLHVNPVENTSIPSTTSSVRLEKPSTSQPFQVLESYISRLLWKQDEEQQQQATSKKSPKAAFVWD